VSGLAKAAERPDGSAAFSFSILAENAEAVPTAPVE
jgi:hypothetical protein